MRALESELTRTFPAIKKQVDSLNIAKIIQIDKNAVKRSIRMHKEFEALMKNFFIASLQYQLKELFDE